MSTGLSTAAAPPAPTAAAIGVLLAVLAPGPLAAQGFRGEARVASSWLEARPLARDSLPESEVPGEGFRRRLSDGTVVTCTPGNFCRWYGAGEVESFFVTTQDLTMTGWAGVPGLSAHVHLRGRYGSDDFWPLTDQELEAVSAYVDYDRSDYRVRAGRVIRTDGLGYYNFDGGAVLWRGWSPFWIEVYGGWGLPRGLNVPRTSELVSSSEVLAPDDRGFIVGAEAGGRLGRILAGRIAYQREIRTDLLAMYSERVSLDARAFLDRALLEFSTEYDWTYEQFNEIRLRVNTPLVANLELTAEGRHQSPFFELWTIWGAFSPVGYNEGRLALAWTEPEWGLRVEAGGAYRDYEETDAGPANSTVRDDGWRAFADASWHRGGWFAAGGYRAEAGFGAARFGGDLRAGRTFGAGTYLSGRASVTQTFGEFRLNEQLVSGIGLDGGIRIGDLSVSGGAGLYRVGTEERPGEGDWTQARVYGSVGYRFGFEPRARPRGPPGAVPREEGS